MAGGAVVDKAELRTSLRARRRELVAARDRATDAANLRRHGLDLVSATGLVAGDTVALYEPLATEPPVEALTEALLGLGIRVIVPITLPDWRLEWCLADDPSRTPLGLDAVAGADLLLIPALTVDAAGHRLGQGGGCYDRTLPLARTGVLVVAVVHPEEDGGGTAGAGNAAVPVEPHDLPVAAVLTADGVRYTGR